MSKTTNFRHCILATLHSLPKTLSLSAIAVLIADLYGYRSCNPMPGRKLLSSWKTPKRIKRSRSRQCVDEDSLQSWEEYKEVIFLEDGGVTRARSLSTNTSLNEPEESLSDLLELPAETDAPVTTKAVDSLDSAVWADPVHPPKNYPKFPTIPEDVTLTFDDAQSADDDDDDKDQDDGSTGSDTGTKSQSDHTSSDATLINEAYEKYKNKMLLDKMRRDAPINRNWKRMCESTNAINVPIYIEEKKEKLIHDLKAIRSKHKGWLNVYIKIYKPHKEKTFATISSLPEGKGLSFKVDIYRQEQLLQTSSGSSSRVFQIGMGFRKMLASICPRKFQDGYVAIKAHRLDQWNKLYDWSYCSRLARTHRQELGLNGLHSDYKWNLYIKSFKAVEQMTTKNKQLKLNKMIKHHQFEFISEDRSYF